MPAVQALHYLGAKSRQLRQILPSILPRLQHVDEFREPFAGSGVVGMAVMARCPRLSFWLNDRDPAMACLWWSLRNRTEDLVKMVEAFDPTKEAFEAFKIETESLLNCPDDPAKIVQLAFMTLAVHRLSFGGYGRAFQTSRQPGRPFRWNRDAMVETIQIIGNRLCRCDVRVTGYDWQRLLINNGVASVFYYLDPPYVVDRENWNGYYYSHGLEYQDHVTLAETLRTLSHPWVLSMGDSHRVRRLYEWAHITEIGARELLITSAAAQ
jgi:DNA adenine methylase